MWAKNKHQPQIEANEPVQEARGKCSSGVLLLQVNKGYVMFGFRYWWKRFACKYYELNTQLFACTKMIILHYPSGNMNNGAANIAALAGAGVCPPAWVTGGVDARSGRTRSLWWFSTCVTAWRAEVCRRPWADDALCLLTATGAFLWLPGMQDPLSFRADMVHCTLLYQRHSSYGWGGNFITYAYF